MTRDQTSREPAAHPFPIPRARGDVDRWVGPHRIISELGRGAMGVVHLALDPSGRTLAVKSSLTSDERAFARLLAESSVRIGDPHVVRIVGAGVDASGWPYVAMEHLVGRTLAAHLAERIPPVLAVSLVAQAADGLAALHERGIVHRDVKPANLFVTTAGVVKVIDLGMATSERGAALDPDTATLVGTPSYLAPEQARGDARVDARADLWSLGVVLFEALTGTRPFDRGDAAETIRAVATAPIPDVSPARASSELVALVRACLSRDPGERPSSARALSARLRALAGNAETDACPHRVGPPALSPRGAPRRSTRHPAAA